MGMAHVAKPTLLGMRDVPGIDHRVPIYGDCAICGRPVRQMTGLGKRPDGSAVFYHASGPAGPNDPRRQTPRRDSWNKAISDGMKAANARRRAR